MEQPAGRAGINVFCRLAAAISLALCLNACQYIGEENYAPKAEVVSHYKDRTIYYWGNWGAIVYYSPDGEAFLWPGKSQHVFRGQWKMDETSESNRICSRYAPYKYNPITGIDQSQWSCSLLSQEQFYTRDEASGDPIELTRRTTMPFSLSSLDTKSLEVVRKSLPALP